LRNKQRKEEEEDDEDDDSFFKDKIKIENTPVNLTELDIHDLSKKTQIKLDITDPILDDIEVLV